MGDASGGPWGPDDGGDCGATDDEIIESLQSDVGYWHRETKSLRERVKAAEVLIATLATRDPLMDPVLLMRAYVDAYPEPIAGPEYVDVLARAAAGKGEQR
jgi:hypothetical protein